MRISTVQLQLNAVSEMINRQAELGKTQQEVASGKKFLSPSDDPPGAVAALDYSRQIGSLDQYKVNIERAYSASITEEATLAAIQDKMLRLQDLALEAGNGSLGASGRSAISYEVRGLLQDILNTANTRDANGDYIFSGFESATQPYTDAGGGVFTYNGDQGQRLIEIAPSTRVAASDPGARIFGGLDAAAGGKTDVFAIIADFATDLEAGTFNVNTITDLNTAMTSVLGARAVTGTRLNALEGIKTLNESFTLDAKKNLSDVQDLDYAEAIGRLNLQLAGLEAAQQAFTRIQNLSLFNFLR